jgi:hypothetical protein
MKRPPCSSYAVLMLPLNILLWSAAVVAQVPTPADDLAEVKIKALREKLTDMRARIVETEDRFYDEYNKLNINDDFDMVCNLETPIDSHRKLRVCRPVYAKEAVEQESQGYLAAVTGQRLGAIDNPVAPSNLVIAGRYGDFQKNMARLIAKHPELKKLLRERELLEKKYDALRKKKLKGRMFVIE